MKKRIYPFKVSPRSSLLSRSEFPSNTLISPTRQHQTSHSVPVRDRQTWCAAAHGVVRSRARLSDWTTAADSTSVQFSRSVVSDSLRPHESQHARPPCPSPSPRAHSDSRPSSPWCHPAISSLVVPFSSCPQSLPASGSFPMSQLFTWDGQSIGVSALASVLPMNTQNLFPSE